MLQNKRLNYIDWFKAIGICLIVIGHCLPAYTLPRTLIYSFHVPLFAFAGGFLSRPSTTIKDCLKKVVGVFKRMGIPYLIWFIINCYPYMMKECPFKTDYSFSELLEIFFLLNGRPMWNAALWFIPCYILVSLVFIFFAYLVKGNKFACLGLGAAGFTGIIILELTNKTVNIFGYTNIFSMSNALLLLGFYCVGYAIKDLVKYVVERKESPYKNYMLYIALGVFITSMIVCALVNRDATKPGGYYGMSVLNLNYNNIFVYISLGIVILISLLLSCALLPSIGSITRLSQSSFFIMATHYLFFNSPYYTSPSWKEGKWQQSLHTGIKEAFYIILIYLVVLYVLYKIREKSKIVSKILMYFGI